MGIQRQGYSVNFARWEYFAKEHVAMGIAKVA